MSEGEADIPVSASIRFGSENLQSEINAVRETIRAEFLKMDIPFGQMLVDSIIKSEAAIAKAISSAVAMGVEAGMASLGGVGLGGAPGTAAAAATVAATTAAAANLGGVGLGGAPGTAAAAATVAATTAAAANAGHGAMQFGGSAMIKAQMGGAAADALWSPFIAVQGEVMPDEEEEIFEGTERPAVEGEVMPDEEEEISEDTERSAADAAVIREALRNSGRRGPWRPSRGPWRPSRGPWRPSRGDWEPRGDWSPRSDRRPSGSDFGSRALWYLTGPFMAFRAARGAMQFSQGEARIDRRMEETAEMPTFTEEDRVRRTSRELSDIDARIAEEAGFFGGMKTGWQASREGGGVVGTALAPLAAVAGGAWGIIGGFDEGNPATKAQRESAEVSRTIAEKEKANADFRERVVRMEEQTAIEGKTGMARHLAEIEKNDADQRRMLDEQLRVTGNQESYNRGIAALDQQTAVAKGTVAAEREQDSVAFLAEMDDQGEIQKRAMLREAGLTGIERREEELYALQKRRDELSNRWTRMRPVQGQGETNDSYNQRLQSVLKDPKYIFAKAESDQFLEQTEPALLAALAAEDRHEARRIEEQTKIMHMENAGDKAAAQKEAVEYRYNEMIQAAGTLEEANALIAQKTEALASIGASHRTTMNPFQAWQAAQQGQLKAKMFVGPKFGGNDVTAMFAGGLPGVHQMFQHGYGGNTHTSQTGLYGWVNSHVHDLSHAAAQHAPPPPPPPPQTNAGTGGDAALAAAVAAGLHQWSGGTPLRIGIVSLSA